MGARRFISTQRVDDQALKASDRILPDRGEHSAIHGDIGSAARLQALTHGMVLFVHVVPELRELFGFRRRRRVDVGRVDRPTLIGSVDRGGDVEMHADLIREVPCLNYIL